MAAGDAGEEFLTKLHRLTRATIAASTRRIGNPSRGGTWQFDVILGAIASPFLPRTVAFTPAAIQAYAGVLATFTVTNTNDSGEGSLQQAILNANANPGADTITFGGSVFTDSTPDTITPGSVPLGNGTGTVTITDDTTIIGTGTNLLTVTGIGFGIGSAKVKLSQLSFRSFFGVPDGATVTLDNVLVGDQIAGSSPYRRITIKNSGKLTLINSAISGLGSSSSDLASDFTNTSSGILTLVNSTISGRQGVLSGGSLSNEGTATLINSTVRDNAAIAGGGIKNSGNLLLVNSTISNNNAAENGSGLYNSGTATVFNSTISSNNITRSRPYNYIQAGIFNDGNLTISNSTVTQNSSIGSTTGGGIRNASGNVTIQNSIIAGNGVVYSGNSFPAYDVEGSFIDNGSNLIGAGDRATGFTTSTLVGTFAARIDPKLGTLANNGGSTQTNALLGGSPAINAGSNALIPADITDLDGDGNTTEPIPFDQRGIGFPRINGSTVDIGAFEAPLNQILGTAGRDTLTGTAGSDRITGGFGGDTITGGEGNDEFVYVNVRDAGDRITDFTVGKDKIVLSQLLDSLVPGGYTGNAIADGYIRAIGQGNDSILQLDQDGTGTATFRSFITLVNVSAAAVNNPNNFVF